jgi:archaeal preflagellin peptidase FlaK
LNLTVFSANILIASAMLLFTSYLDLRKREVPDKVWIIFGAIGVALEIYEVKIGETALISLTISVILATVIGLGIFFAGLYGGADGKALIVLAILVPYFVPRIGIYHIAPLIVLTNGILLSMLLPAALVILNVSRLVRGKKIFEGFSEPVYRKILATFLGYKSTGRPRDFQFSMEKKNAQSENIQGKKFDFSFMQDNFETAPGTWVTPGIPLLVFFTAGFFVLLLYGDLVISIVQFLAHSI